MNISPVSSIPSLNIGGRLFTDLSSNLIVLSVMINGNAAARWSTLRKMSVNTSGGYAVTATKTLTILAVQGTYIASGTGGGLWFGYGDTDVGGNSAASPAAGVNIMADANNWIFTGTITPSTSSFIFQLPVNYTIPAGKFPFITQSGNAATMTITAWGYEA